MLKGPSNKHLIAALIVTPILAVLGYLAADAYLDEPPHPARAGMSYPLVAQSNCRFASGRCDLTNHDFNAQIWVRNDVDRRQLLVKSAHRLQRVEVAFAHTDSEDDKTQWRSMTPDALYAVWTLELPPHIKHDSRLMIVLKLGNANFFAETALAFARQTEQDNAYKPTPD